MLRRMNEIDYASPGYYMVTMNISAYTPRLSKVVGRAFKPVEQGKAANNSPAGSPLLIPETDCKYGPDVVVNDWGAVVSREIYALRERYPVIVKCMVIMPDHIHVLLHVTEYNPAKLGGIVASFKGRCSRAFWNAKPQYEGRPFWQGKYNDKPVFAEGQLPRFFHYIKENPRKYLIRKEMAEYFYLRWQFEFEGETYHAIGNIFLLMHHERSAIRFSRKFKPEEFEQMKTYWMKMAEKKDVIISTFIHPEERAITKECTAAGASLIWLKTDGFPPRSAVKGDTTYDMCAKGRLLMIAPEKYHTSQQELKRSHCMKLNRLAEYLSYNDIFSRVRPLAQR